MGPGKHEEVVGRWLEVVEENLEDRDVNKENVII